MNSDLSDQKCDGLQLIIGEQDLDPTVRARVKAALAGQSVLGGEEDAVRILFDSLPIVLAKRLKAITPADFRVAEIELEISLGGKLFGAELSGHVVVRLAPKE